MRNPLRAALLASGLLALSSCGSLVAQLIPPQTVQNPMGLNNQQLASDTTFAPAAVSTTVTYEVNTDFADIDTSSFPSIVKDVKPNSITLNVDLLDVTLTGVCTVQTSMPSSLSFTVSEFSVSAYDVSAPTSGITVTGTNTLTLNLTKSGTKYVASGDKTTKVTADAVSAVKLYTILTTGGANRGKATAKITSPENGLNGCGARFTLGNASATLSNFK